MMIFRWVIGLMLVAVTTAGVIYISETTPFPENIRMPDFSRDVDPAPSNEPDAEPVTDPEPVPEPATQPESVDDTPEPARPGTIDEPEDPYEASRDLDLLMDQAELIQTADIRDRAYMRIAGQALDNGDVETAREATDLIGELELRASMQGQMAVAYARAGDMDAAFAAVDDVDVPELHDIIRLQIIEVGLNPAFDPYR